MKLSISNIAWDIAEEPAIADLLAEKGLDQVDVAPGKYFADPAAATAAEVERVRRWWTDRGFRVVGMQGLLFGTSGMNLFSDDGRMLDRLAATCRIGAGLGARALTFGSPNQRDPAGLDAASARAVAVDFFRRLGDEASRHGVVVCLEPVPAAYGCNFLTRTAEAAEMVEAVDHPAVRLQLDVGTIAVNGEPAAETVRAHAALIGHVHASAPGLVTLDEAEAPHAAAAEALRSVRPDLTVTIEMVAAKRRAHADAVSAAVEVAQRAYGAAG